MTAKKEPSAIKLVEVTGTDGKHGSPILPHGKKNFIVDIDGVVCEDVPNEEAWRMPDAAEIPGSKEQINRWFDEGNIISFFTARTEEHRAATEGWLKKHGFKYHKLLMGKPRGGNYHYIDDRVIKATRFEGKLGKLVKKKLEIEVFE